MRDACVGASIEEAETRHDGSRDEVKGSTAWFAFATDMKTDDEEDEDPSRSKVRRRGVDRPRLVSERLLVGCDVAPRWHG